MVHARRAAETNQNGQGHEIRLGYNAVPKEAEKDLIRVFRSGQYSPGPKVKEFEEAWAKAHQAKYAVFVNSGTDALRLSLLALKEKYQWKDGDEVAVPALTFPATINVVIQANLKPFFVDVGMYDYTMNPYNLQRRLQTAHSQVKCVMPVHLFGQACDDHIYEIARKYKFRVLEDSCETVLNKPRGDVSCHSTYMAHHVTTGVGGFAVTNNKDLRYLIWSYANHGRREMGKFNYDRIGYSCRGTEFEAVLGLSQIPGLKKHVNDRRRVFVELLDAFGTFDEFQTVGVMNNTCMMFPVVIKETSKLKKYNLCEHLEKNDIETRDMMPITNQACYRKIVNEDDFPVAKHINRNGFYIPCNPQMGKKEIQHIKETFESYLQKN